MEPPRSWRLTRAWSSTSTRLATDDYGWRVYPPSDEIVVDEVAAVAARRGVSQAQVALAWLLRRPAVPAPVVGVTSVAQLDDAVAALDLDLTTAETTALEAGYQPRPVLFT